MEEDFDLGRVDSCDFGEGESRYRAGRLGDGGSVVCYDMSGFVL